MKKFHTSKASVRSKGQEKASAADRPHLGKPTSSNSASKARKSWEKVQAEGMGCLAGHGLRFSAS